MVTVFHITTHADVVNAQTWEVSTQKNPVEPPYKWLSEKTGQNVKNVNGRGSTEQVHTNIIDRSGGVMDKYTKHRFFTAFVLEIRASLYSTPLGHHFYTQIITIF